MLIKRSAKQSSKNVLGKITLANPHKHTHTNTHTNTQTYTQTHTQIHTHTNTRHSYTCTLLHGQTHTHTQQMRNSDTLRMNNSKTLT
jgi:hypothetical protein